ncbi:hypothetical protein EI94DRAFT_1700651 [Lactarius quietus]|nr:hypothetical protein EI94DRAFT_1708084 [Lactarius quietus]KAF8267880.1 hypothetical protein EI94DRAFT_1700651 [Lactarius quietus]
MHLPLDLLDPPSQVEHDARPLPAPGPPPAPQSTGDTGMFDFLDHVPLSVLGPTQSMGPPRSISAPVISPEPPASTASAGGQSTYAFLSPVVGQVEVTLSVITAGSVLAPHVMCHDSTNRWFDLNPKAFLESPLSQAHGLQLRKYLKRVNNHGWSPYTASLEDNP